MALFDDIRNRPWFMGQAPILEEIEWQWRAETTVRSAMIETDEADWAFLITLEEAEGLGPERFVTGGTAEIAQFTIDAIWHPWLTQLKMRQALVHSIDCQAIIDALYRGLRRAGATTERRESWASRKRTSLLTSSTQSRRGRCWKTLGTFADWPTRRTTARRMLRLPASPTESPRTSS